MSLKIGPSGGNEWTRPTIGRRGSLDSAAGRVQIGAKSIVPGAATSPVQNVRRNTISVPSDDAAGRPVFSRDEVNKLVNQARSEVLYREAKIKEKDPEAKPGNVTTAFYNAAKAGNLRAAFKLILLRAKGWGVRKTDTIESAIANAKASNPRVLCQEARDLEKAGKPEDLEMARAMYEAAADQGDATALYKAAEFCRRGIGGDADSGKALTFYEQAAKKNNAMAAFELAKMYRNGDKSMGVAKDETKYKEFLKQAASLGNREALKEYDPIALQEKAQKIAAQEAAQLNDDDVGSSA